jgi:hypothetical protein
MSQRRTGNGNFTPRDFHELQTLNNWRDGLHQAAGIIERQDFKIIFQYHPPGKDKSPYRKLSQDFVRIETFGLHEFIRVERESLRLPAEQGDEGPRRDSRMQSTGFAGASIQASPAYRTCKIMRASLMVWTAPPRRHQSAKAWPLERHKEGDRP